MTGHFKARAILVAQFKPSPPGNFEFETSTKSLSALYARYLRRGINK